MRIVPVLAGAVGCKSLQTRSVGIVRVTQKAPRTRDVVTRLSLGVTCSEQTVRVNQMAVGSNSVCGTKIFACKAQALLAEQPVSGNSTEWRIQRGTSFLREGIARTPIGKMRLVIHTAQRGPNSILLAAPFSAHCMGIW